MKTVRVASPRRLIWLSSLINLHPNQALDQIYYRKPDDYKNDHQPVLNAAIKKFWKIVAHLTAIMVRPYMMAHRQRNRILSIYSTTAHFCFIIKHFTSLL